MMKRILCMMLCMLMIAPAALAAGDATPMKKFRQQVITGGNGIGGAVYLTASGVADWMSVLSPFTAGKMNIRIIGQAQGDKAEGVDDVNDWQFKIYTKDGQEQLHAVTHFYGDPDAVYFKSELLPDVLLTMPVEDVHPLYQLIDGELLSMITGFDPLGIAAGQTAGNESSLSAVSSLLQIDEMEWADKWEPVLSRYYTDLDMWLSLYGSEPVVSGSTGSMTMTTSYRIPSRDLKDKAKSLVAMMVYDSELQTLLLPYVTLEQRMLYLNPSLTYYYDYCIDSIPLAGDVYLEREMTTLGEVIAMTISLPAPQLPESITEPIGNLLADVFCLPARNVLDGLQRMTFRQSGNDMSLSFTGPMRSITITVDESVSNAETAQHQGHLQITPADGVDEAPLSAAFNIKTSHRIWEDDEWVLHEDYSYAASIEPDQDQMESDDTLQSIAVDFPPLAFEVNLNFSLETDRANRPVLLDMNARALLPDAELGMSANLRTLVAWELEDLPKNGAEDVRTLSEEQAASLLAELTMNAIQVMSSLNTVPAESGEPVVQEMPAPAPTAVPPMTE